MVHGMLLNKPFIKGIPYTFIDDIKDTKADITLSWSLSFWIWDNQY